MSTGMTPDKALARLQQGNADFLADRMQALPTHRERRLEIAQAQSPFAVLVGCSDSRVSPELLFGVGLGELFIVRNAGNTVGTSALGSIEYGVLVLGTPLVVVLGHQRCGAVEAAVRAVQEGAEFPGSIGTMIEPIMPSVERSLASGATAADLVEAATRANVLETVERLRDGHPGFAERVRAGALRIVGAHYSLDDGHVDFFAI